MGASRWRWEWAPRGVGLAAFTAVCGPGESGFPLRVFVMRLAAGERASRPGAGLGGASGSTGACGVARGGRRPGWAAGGVGGIEAGHGPWHSQPYERQRGVVISGCSPGAWQARRACPASRHSDARAAAGAPRGSGAGAPGTVTGLRGERGAPPPGVSVGGVGLDGDCRRRSAARAGMPIPTDVRCRSRLRRVPRQGRRNARCKQSAPGA